MTTLAALFKSSLPSETLSSLQKAPAINDQIITLLLDNKCCFRCVLRFLGDRQSKTHQIMPMHTLPATVNDSNAALTRRTAIAMEGIGAVFTAHTCTDTEKDAQPVETMTSPLRVQGIPKCVCPACLGLLQIDYSSLATQAYQKYLNKPYIRNEMTFSVSNRMPPQLSIRQRSISLMIEKMLASISSTTSDEKIDIPTPIEVKEIFKSLICASFSQESGMVYDVESKLSLQLHLEHPATATDFMFLTKIPHAKFNVKTTKRKGVMIYAGASIEKIAKAVALAKYEDFYAHEQIPLSAVDQLPSISNLDFNHSQIYIAGRYCKLQRGISNSPWIIGGKRLTEHSVEELVGSHIDLFFGVSEHKFSSAGREDGDVLMLGTGRPFYYELINPYRCVATESELATLQRKINDSNKDMVSVRDVQIVTRESTSIMKDSASSKSKSYSCVVEFSKPVSMFILDEIAKRTDIAVAQKNPTRVPRRADLLRHKMIETIEFVPIEMSLMEDDSEGVKTVRVNMKTSAGTYVKEFVHGDNGRTEPCLASLVGVESAKVIELDVLEIHLSWPPAKHRE
ncbi:hypothetical protein BATDEDRAFT_90402 [Batrachochytrium dendrobatidis JAM81]|uniref:tRNA pseudouridine(55) synthase n=1 Tax=Batrachochytrium dendrobatidis (strain JAM81 / FGSC 10211) TaxID=684364 RepID=F4P7R3_BATDJ|nr:uncharacterized protein BATDEDRAFT_90402 [Batrachochytrium dendrobatidis JAM81]EGF78467.1 hypothetical protein BATDEDRAFT_90402 [Batrachochytrium dendrobatidis JAM81]KAJ8324121.1 hypothetical protein O5D80_007327 [Batrachochytrium dendrobatidis]KAK5664915.1 hypothetical protein QVD99_008455 [Batrachochytrium dendrobatidis]|eukprot:XP_006680854.1 hypothetical protein BATDEDRAFT_90402 [Batrachochytrium dendrobatidis JAM81]